MNRKMVKIVSILFSLLLCMYTICYAGTGVDDLITSMNSTSTPDITAGSHGTVQIVNTAIGFLQIAGSGIALIVITVLGIKYILAAPGEKADIKKMATPIVIGCALVFGAVNLAAIIESFSGNVLK